MNLEVMTDLKVSESFSQIENGSGSISKKWTKLNLTTLNGSVMYYVNAI